MKILSLLGKGKEPEKSFRILDQYPHYFVVDLQIGEIGKVSIKYHVETPSFAQNMSADRQALASRSIEITKCTFNKDVPKEIRKEAVLEILALISHKARCSELNSIWSFMANDGNEFIKHAKGNFETWDGGIHFIRLISN
jgi:hypothetical protein